MGDATVDLWALDEVHFQQQGSRCRMWIPPELKDPVVYHHPTRKSVGYFAAVRLRDGKFLFRREAGRFNGETFWEFLKVFREVSVVPGGRVMAISERVWKLTRRLCLHNRYFGFLDSVVAAVEGQFAEWTKPNDALRRLCAIT